MVKKSKNFIQEIQDLESSLHGLEGRLRTCKDRTTYNKILKQIPLQQERIEWFRRGYNFCKSEMLEQLELKCDSCTTNKEKQNDSPTR